MQVEFKKPSVVDFNKIEVGELFYDDDDVFMKIQDFEDANEDISNAICLDDGKFAFYSSLDRVNKVSGKLVVTLV
jgi:hypothetical protein